MSFLRHYDLMIPSLDSGSRTKSFSTNYTNYNVIARQNDVITDVFMFSVLVCNSNYKCPINCNKIKEQFNKITSSHQLKTNLHLPCDIVLVCSKYLSKCQPDAYQRN